MASTTSGVVGATTTAEAIGAAATAGAGLGMIRRSFFLFGWASSTIGAAGRATGTATDTTGAAMATGLTAACSKTTGASRICLPSTSRGLTQAMGSLSRATFSSQARLKLSSIVGSGLAKSSSGKRSLSGSAAGSSTVGVLRKAPAAPPSSSSVIIIIVVVVGWCSSNCSKRARLSLPSKITTGALHPELAEAASDSLAPVAETEF